MEEKIDRKVPDRYLDINQTADHTSLSVSTIRRAVAKGEFKCGRKLGKLLFQFTDMIQVVHDKESNKMKVGGSHLKHQQTTLMI